jgi:hypothetical protein
MTKYLLVGWKKAIREEIDRLCEPHKDEKNPPDQFRNVWLYFCQFIKKEISEGDMIEEFEDFAHEYARNYIKLKLNSYLLYRYV